MKKRNPALIFVLTALASACFVTCENPIMKKWWEEPDPTEIIREVVRPESVYTVTFDMNGGQYVDSTKDESGAIDTAPVTQRVMAGGKVADPGLAINEGLYLAGWTSGTQLWNFAVNTVTADKVDSAGNMTLTAQWETSGWTVAFDLNLPTSLGEDEISYKPVNENIANNAKATEPLEFGLVNKSDRSAPYYGDYSFRGWYTEKECKTLWNFNDNFVTGNMILYAGWGEPVSSPVNGEPEQVVYAVLWDNGGALSSPPSQYLYAEARIAAPFPITKPGYAFGGWYTDKAFTRQWDFSADTVNDEAWSKTYDDKSRKIINLYAKWTVGTITVKFDSKGGTYIDLTPVNGKYDISPVDQKVVVGGKISDPGLVELAGSYLGGWYTSSGKNWNFARDNITNDIVSRDVDSNGVLTLTAKWETSGYTVTFDLNIDDDDVLKIGDISYQPVPERIAKGARAAEPLEFGSENSGISFRGWYKEEDCKTLWKFHEDTVAGSMTLYAGWAVDGIPKVPDPEPVPEPPEPPEQDPVYVVIWHDNGATSMPPYQYLLEEATIVTPLPITKPGYAFGGWYIDSGFSGNPWDFTTKVDETISYSLGPNDVRIVTLYAKWEPIDSIDEITVKFDPNGGTYVDLSAPIDLVPADQKVVVEGKISDPGLVKKDNSYLDGWYTSSGQNWNFAKDNITDSIVSNDVENGVLTLTAKWKTSGYTVTFDLNLEPDDVLKESDISYKPVDEYIAFGARMVEPLEFGSINSKYSFRGWYKEEDCKTLWKFHEDTVTGNTTLYAGWAVNGIPKEEIPEPPPEKQVVYAVRWFDNAPSIVDLPEQYLLKGAFIVAPRAITRPGYAFGGWYIDSGFSGNPWDFTTGVDSIYASETVNDIQIIKLYAKWVLTELNVEFATNGGTYVDLTEPVDPVPPPQRIAIGGKISNPGLVTKPSYYLEGWDAWTYNNGSIDKGHTGPPWDFNKLIDGVDTGNYVDPATGIMTLYARWAADGCRVVFDLNLESFDDPSITENSVTYTPLEEYIAYNSLVTVPMDFSLKNPDDNHGFIGWYKDSPDTGALWDFSKPVTTADVTEGVLTLYAKWKKPPDPGYAVQWDNGNAYSSPMPQYLQEGARIAAPAIITNPGHAFAGWYTDRAFSRQWDFSVDTVNASHSSGSDTKNRKIITLYAKWIVPDMVFVPWGSYTMGGEGYSNTSPYPKVSISSFYISPSEVPNSKYREVIGYIPSHWTGDDNPVEQVTWYDAVYFCNTLSVKEGLTPYYDMANIVWGDYSGTKFIKSADVTVSSAAAGAFNDGYRLPTEAEWEYAARGGNGTPGDYTYAGSNNVDDVAWYDKNSASSTHSVKTKQPNGLGLYDMSGNVSEWCWDWYDSTYYKNYTGVTDPVNSAASSKNPGERVRRGGNWNMIDVKTRSRTNTNPGTFSYIPSADDLKRFWTIGFRVARSLRPNP